MIDLQKDAIAYPEWRYCDRSPNQQNPLRKVVSEEVGLTYGGLQAAPLQMEPRI